MPLFGLEMDHPAIQRIRELERVIGAALHDAVLNKDKFNEAVYVVSTSNIDAMRNAYVGKDFEPFSPNYDINLTDPKTGEPLSIRPNMMVITNVSYGPHDPVLVQLPDSHPVR